MKVAHVVRQFPPSIGGLEESVLKLGVTLQARGIDIRVVTLDRIAKGHPSPLPARDVVGGLDVRRIPFRGSWRYPLAPSVVDTLGDADIVHVHGIDFFFDYLALTRAWHRKPLVASTHGGFFHTTFAQRAKRLYFATATRAAARAYDAICASSQSDFALFRAIAGGRLLLAPNGVDTDKWRDLAPAEPVRRLIYVGRFSSNKNIAALFPVLRQLQTLHPAWALTIAGRPWDVTAAELRAEAARNGEAEAVTLLENPDDAAIAEVIGTASYIVSASRHEGFGISIVEGLSAGLVPVLSRIPPFEALVRDGNLGCLVDFDDPASAAAAIEAQHRHFAQAPLPMRAAALRAARPYSWATSADVVQHAYAAALRGQRAPASTAPARGVP